MPDWLPFLVVSAALIAWAYLRQHSTQASRRFGRRRPPDLKPTRGWQQRKPEWVRTEVVRLKALGPALSCRTIAMLFNRRFARARGITVGRTFVSCVLRTHAHEIALMRQRVRRRRPAAGPRNRVWGLDLTGKTDEAGKTHLILGLVDHGSRANLSLRALTDKSTIALLRALLDAVERYGRPRVLRTDNEPMFASRLFRFALWWLDIRHQRIEPLCPWQNGRVERFFGTLKASLDRWAVPDLTSLQGSLAQFRLFYNHIRPHQHLAARTPAELWSGVNPFARHAGPAVWFEAWDGLLCGEYLPP